MRLRVGEALIESRYAIPADRRVFTLARRELAARLEDPDPFAALRAVEAGAIVEDATGLPVDVDTLDAALLRAALARPKREMIFPFRWKGAAVRSIPVDLRAVDPLAAALRWPVTRPPPIGTITVRRHAGPPGAVIRGLVPLPDGRLGVGTDQGAFLFDGAFSEFPYPIGARRTRVEASAVIGTTWSVASQEAWFDFDMSTGTVTSRRLPSDGDDGRDDVRAMLAAGHLYVGWRCRFEGGDGPAEACSLTVDADGVVWAGTLDGQLWVVDGGLVRRFGEAKGRPIRHLAFALGRLFAAADGRLWSFDGATWTSEAEEPTSLAADPAGRLWSVRGGRVSVDDGRSPRTLDLPIERPWSLLGTATGAWIGGPDALVEVRCG